MWNRVAAKELRPALIEGPALGTHAAHGEEYPLGCGRAVERRRRRSRAERGDGVAKRFADRDRQHQRRLADRLAAEDDAGLRRRAARKLTSKSSGISDHDGSL